MAAENSHAYHKKRVTKTKMSNNKKILSERKRTKKNANK
jgi:hypothetical protein